MDPTSLPIYINCAQVTGFRNMSRNGMKYYRAEILSVSVQFAMFPS